MAVINILDDNTIDRIAAGEVVERPSSVVKELVENAIDSGAGAISVAIKDGGLSMIRVTDNGCGIDKNMVRTAFLRHATSKIKSAEDLLSISSLGFRGEALSSICSVSRTEVMTKTANDILGTRYIISGGKEEVFEDAGVPCGTTVIVRNLFYNTPARRKFLKSANTETGYISDLMEKLILSHPDISFKYTVNGNDKINSPAGNSLKDTVYTLFGRDILSSMIYIEKIRDNATIKGYVGKAEIARGNRNNELFYINGRLVKSKLLSSAVEEAYKPYLMLHKYPFVLMYADISGDEIDVNVHPAKTEIRFMNESFIYDLFKSSVTEGLGSTQLIPDVRSIEKESEFSKNDAVEEKAKEFVPDSLVNISIRANNVPEPFELNKINRLKEQFKAEADKISDIKSGQEELFTDGFLSEAARIKHRIIGQIFDTYWLVEYDSKLYIIDQHAAHEKVLYENICKRVQKMQAISQPISPPTVVSLTAAEIHALKEYEESLRLIGFEAEEFGGNEYLLCAVPYELFGMTEKEYFVSVLDDLDSIKGNMSLDTINDRIATMACKAAVKGNMKMSDSEARALIDELMQLENPFNCPHGRPTIITYSKSELEKLFKRIV